MSRFWPHTPYAEDQPYSHPILYTHVLTRAVQAGTVVGTGIGTTVFVLRRTGILKPAFPPTTFTTTLLRSAGVGSVVGLGLLSVGLPMRMRDQEEIQWRDRSWRLLENKGQVEVDDWTYSGMALGLASAATARGGGWRAAVGRVGVGSIVGVMGYMGWRYGVNGGKREGGDAKAQGRDLAIRMRNETQASVEGLALGAWAGLNFMEWYCTIWDIPAA